jgi:hypothetical protein
LDHFILVIENWPNDACFGCEETKENSLYHFLTRECKLIKEHNKFLAKQGLFKEDFDFD